METEWLDSNGFKNKNFMIYKMYIQIYNISKQIQDKKLRDYLLYELQRQFPCKMVYSSVATMKHLWRNNLFLLKTIVRSWARR